ncbi:MAG: hypothetical protein GYA38_09600 [Chloroflexi bacterium]|jgi:hypothetical protein|nr:hypothetical protein [Chloroflexota bacterium]
MIVLNSRQVIERLKVLDHDLQLMRETVKGKPKNTVVINPQTFLYDVLIAVFGHRQGKKLWKDYFNAID